MIQLLFEIEVPKGGAKPTGDRAIQVSKLQEDIRKADRAVSNAQDELEDAEAELQDAEEALENFLRNGTANDDEVATFGKAMLSRERFLSGAARETIENIVYGGVPVGPLLSIAQNYGWSIPDEVRDMARKTNNWRGRAS